MRRLLQYLLLVCILTVGSLTQSHADGWPKKLHFEGFASASHISTSGMNLWVTINNESIWRYEIKSCEVDIAIDGNHLATISLRDKVVIPRKHEGDILLPLRFEARSSFVLGRLLWRIIQGESERITLSYRMKAGLRVISRRYEESDIRLNEIISTRKLVLTAIEELWELLE